MGDSTQPQQKYAGAGENGNIVITVIFYPVIKMPQSGVGSMQGKNTGNMPSAMYASSMNKSLDPTPI